MIDPAFGSAAGFVAWVKAQPMSRPATTIQEALDDYMRSGAAPLKLAGDIERLGAALTRQHSSAEDIAAKCLAAQSEVDRLTAELEKYTKGAEPVAAESRFEGEQQWARCTVEHHLMVQANPVNWGNYETRALYTHQHAAQQDAKDAQRYRWLKATSSVAPNGSHTIGYCSYPGKTIDAAIDAAIAKGEPQ